MKIKTEKEDTLLNILLQNFPESNKTRLRKMVKLGCVSMNGAIIRHPEILIKRNQTLDFKKYNAREAHKEKAPFQIVYEDESLIAVFKPAGVLSSGRTTEKISSMFGMVKKFLMRVTAKREQAYTIHRLDREVSGILLFAKSEQAQAILKENWVDVQKLYYALVEDCPPKDKGTIKTWLKEDGKQKMYSLKEEEEGAKWSVTHYKVIEKYEGCTLLQVELETGRKNQIRVHLSDLGCAIIGDRKYGADARIRRQIRLLAYSLSFKHPITGVKIKLEIPLPKTFMMLGEDHEC